MNTSRACAIVSTLLIGASIATSTYAQDYKIGAVNAIRILEQSPQIESVRSSLDKEFAPRDRELVAAQKTLKEMEDRLAKDAAIMSENERQKLERDIIEARRSLKRDQDEFREDATYRRNEEMQKIQIEIIEAIQVVAKQNNYDLVVSEGVVFASPKVDMTQLVIDYLRKKNSGGDQAAAQ